MHARRRSASPLVCPARPPTAQRVATHPTTAASAWARGVLRHEPEHQRPGVVHLNGRRRHKRRLERTGPNAGSVVAIAPFRAQLFLAGAAAPEIQKPRSALLVQSSWLRRAGLGTRMPVG
jgi:hypothetical protein